jgi:hypothetical protein
MSYPPFKLSGHGYERAAQDVLQLAKPDALFNKTFSKCQSYNKMSHTTKIQTEMF